MGIPYKIRRSKNRKTLEIRILDSGEVLITAPSFMHDKIIASYLMAKKEWIYEKLEVNRQQRLRESTYQENFHYLGESYEKEIILISEAEKEHIQLEGQIAKIYLKKEENEEQLMVDYYRYKGVEVIKELQDKWYPQFTEYPEWVRFKKQKAVWGTYTHTNRIYLNIGLMKAPISIIEYVFIHEMCHIAVKDHSQRFWREVAKYYPDYKEAEDYLKRHRMGLLL